MADWHWLRGDGLLTSMHMMKPSPRQMGLRIEQVSQRC